MYETAAETFEARASSLTPREQEQLAQAYDAMGPCGVWSGIETNEMYWGKMAWHWHQKAAEGNDPDALYALSLQYDTQNAWYVQADMNKSFDYLFRAADAGQQDALLLLIKYDFVSVPAYRDRASNALARAVSNGNTDVIQALEENECQQAGPGYPPQVVGSPDP